MEMGGFVRGCLRGCVDGERMYLLNILLILSVLLVWPSDVLAKMYKWVDENGQIHFSDKPPAPDKKANNLKEYGTIKEEKQGRRRHDKASPAPTPVATYPRVPRAISNRRGDCFESSIISPTPFMGNDGEVFKLSDGSVWEVQNEYEYLHEYNPDVIVCPRKEKLIIGGNSLDINLLSQHSGVAGTSGDRWEIFEETQYRRDRKRYHTARIYLQNNFQGNI